MANTSEDSDAKMLVSLFKDFIKQAPDQRKHELNLLLIKVAILIVILTGATLLTISGKFSPDLTTALYVAAFGYLLGTIK